MGKIDNIKKLLDINGGSRINEEIVSNTIDAIKETYPYLNFDKSKVDLSSIIDEIMEKIIPLYDKTFTDDEILGIIEFYESEVGRSYLKKMGIIVKESVEIGSSFGEIIFKKIMKDNDQSQPLS